MGPRNSHLSIDRDNILMMSRLKFQILLIYFIDYGLFGMMDLGMDSNMIDDRLKIVSRHVKGFQV